MGTAVPPGKARVLVRPNVELPSCTDYSNSWSLSFSYRTSLWRNKNRKNQHSWQWRSLSPPIRTQLKHATKTSQKPRVVHFNNLSSHPTAHIEQDRLNAVTSQARLPSETVLSLSYTQNLNSTYSPSSLDPDAEHGITYNNSGSVVVRENLRPEKVAHANKGKVPWNKGRRHSAETIARIKERTRVAMRSPQVRDKLRHSGKNQSIETKAKIREKMTGVWETKKKMKTAQDNGIKDWKEVVANAARLGGLGEEELEWGTFEEMVAKWRAEDLAVMRQEKERLLELHKAEARARRSLGCSVAHRKAISDAIRAKWADPEYRSRVFAGMRKEKRRPPAPKKRAAVPQSLPLPVEKVKVVQKAPFDEEFVAEVLAEDVGAKVRSARSTAARIRGPQKVTLARPGIKMDASAAEREDSLSEIQDETQKKGVVLPEKENVPTEEQMEVQVLPLDDSVSGALAPLHVTYRDPSVNEKLHKIRLLREGRLVLELKRKEAADRARMLIADAERAARSLERVAETDIITRASLMETRRLLAQATRSMQTADGCWEQETRVPDLPIKINSGESSGSQNLLNQIMEEAEVEDLAATLSGTDFHSRVWTTGHKMTECPHPIPLRVSQLHHLRSRSTEERQLDATMSNTANENSRHPHTNTSRFENRASNELDWSMSSSESRKAGHRDMNMTLSSRTSDKLESRSFGRGESNQPDLNLCSERPPNDIDSNIRGFGSRTATEEPNLPSLHGISGSSPVLESVRGSRSEKLEKSENSLNEREIFVPRKSRDVKKWHCGRLVVVKDSHEL